MSRRPASFPWLRTVAAVTAVVLLVVRGFGPVAGAPLATDVGAPQVASVGHLLISEVQTGGTSASDEFIEVYNPAPGALSLDGLEVVYVTASGATITRKALFATGSQLDPGRHLLIANSAGVYASIADIAYANGLAATGGSVAIRAVGAATAIDAVGWGNATSTWLEGLAAPAPGTGQSLERLPGGTGGSGQDTDSNAVDFTVNGIPGPENLASPAVPAPTGTPSPSGSPVDSPSATPTMSATPSPTVEPTIEPTLEPSASPTPTPSPSPTPTLTPTPTPTPAVLTVAAARGAADGSMVTVEALALTGSDFHDGGGFVADVTAGIAVLVSDGSFTRGQLLRITGTVDDRYSQRTIRADGSAIEVIGDGTDPVPPEIATVDAGEALEGGLVRLAGMISGAPTSLTSGLAFEIDDGSGPVRILVGPGTGIDTATWETGAAVTLMGIVGQRDSSGTGTAGYRVMPRDPADILDLLAPPTPTPSPTPTVTPTPVATSTPTATSAPTANPVPLVSISVARAATVGANLRVRGVVTLPTGYVDEATAALQDASGAIVVRLGDGGGTLSLGQLVEVTGVRSTKSGMATIRVVGTPVELGTQADPIPLRRPTGAITESHEALLVVVRGALTAKPSRSSAGSLSLGLDDGSGPARVIVYPEVGLTATLVKGSWIEVIGVVGQQTTKAEPNEGYRIWPRIAADIRLVAGATTATSSGSGAAPHGSSDVGQPGSSGGPLSSQPAAGLRGTISLAAPEASAAPSFGADVATPGSVPVIPPSIPLLTASLGAIGLIGLLMVRRGSLPRLLLLARERLAELRDLDE